VTLKPSGEFQLGNDDDDVPFVINKQTHLVIFVHSTNNYLQNTTQKTKD